MSKFYQLEYYIKPDGTHVMSHDIFKSMEHKAVCKLLGIKSE